MALPSEGSVQSSFRVKWEKFTASRKQKLQEAKSGEKNAFWFNVMPEILDPRWDPSTMAEYCTYMTQTDVDGARLPIRHFLEKYPTHAALRPSNSTAHRSA
jgi:hypothetical protein